VKLAFFGLPLAALLLARDGHEIVHAGVLPERGLRRLRALLGPSRVRVSPDLDSPGSSDALRRAAPELIVSWFWPRRIPDHVLALATAIGVHPSLLPRYRGPDPYFWAIDSGDPTTGVTAHLLEHEYDTGPVLGQRTLVVDPQWNSWQLARALDRPSLSLLRETVRAYSVGSPPVARRQDEALATPAPQPSEEDLALKWAWPAERIERRIRAAAPSPGAWTEIGDSLVVVLRARVARDWPRVLAPGEAAVRADGIAVVRAGQGAIELLEGRAEEDDAPLGASDFARLVAEARARS
jgi:methionyl-tRNA formyltransferase